MTNEKPNSLNIFDRVTERGRKDGWIPLLDYIKENDIKELILDFLNNEMLLKGDNGKSIIVNIGHKYDMLFNDHSLKHNNWFIKINGYYGKNWLHVLSEYTRIPNCLSVYSERELQLVLSKIKYKTIECPNSSYALSLK